MDWSLIQTAAILGLGAGVFLRLVTKEKQRREKHLQYRLEEQLRKIQEAKEQEEAAKAEKEKAEREQTENQEPVTVNPR